MIQTSFPESGFRRKSLDVEKNGNNCFHGPKYPKQREGQRVGLVADAHFSRGSADHLRPTQRGQVPGGGVARRSEAEPGLVDLPHPALGQDFESGRIVAVE
jgi:hypothetical protein